MRELHSSLQTTALSQKEIHKVAPPQCTQKGDLSWYRCGKLGYTVAKCRFQNAMCHLCGKVGHTKLFAGLGKPVLPITSHNKISDIQSNRFRTKKSLTRYSPCRVVGESHGCSLWRWTANHSQYWSCMPHTTTFGPLATLLRWWGV